VILRLLGYLKPYWHVSVGVGLLMLLGNGGMLIPPYLTKILVDDVLVTQKYDLLGWIVLAMVGISVIAKAMLALRGRISAWLGSIITHEIRSELYGKVQSMSLRFFDRYKTGELMSRVSRDTRELNDFMAFEIPFLVVNFFQLIGISAVLIVMNWKLALLTIIPAPVVAFSTLAIWRRIRYYYRRAWHRRAQLSAALNDTLSGIRVVKGFAQEEKQAEKFGRKSYDLYLATKRAEQLWATWMPMLTFMLGAGTLIVWYFGGRDVMGGHMSFGTLVAFIAYLVVFLGPLEMVMRISTWITRSFAAAERVFEILDMEPEVPDEAETIAMSELKGFVEFRDVTFGYDRHKPVLHNIELKVEPGEMIGFVGRSGAGKTTMTNLICRFYTPDEGAILIDSVDTRKMRLEDLRRQIGIVLQEPFLFNGTIAENIGYAKPGATLEEIMRAARIANAHEFILKFPDGYDTITGERGQRLSGGERQRISIARAILRDPRILILDEPTSMVDTMTEKKIQEALSRLVKGRTTFAIAHRLSTLRNANRLVVLDEGKVVETGTHDELMAKEGTYRKLVDLQREMSHIKGIDG
jgi:ATP-binding cassette subfamily B protein